MELLSVFVSPCLNKTSLHYPDKSATWMKKCQRKFQKTDTIQTERDHILMLLKRWRASREETEIQKTKDVFENGKTICYVLTKKKKKMITNRLKNIVKVGLDLSVLFASAENFLVKPFFSLMKKTATPFHQRMPAFIKHIMVGESSSAIVCCF